LQNFYFSTADVRITGVTGVRHKN